MAMNLNEVAKANEYGNEYVNEIAREDVKNVEELKSYYEKATDEEKNALNEQFNTYLDEELQKDEELRDTLNNSEKKESSEISEEDVANLNTVRNLTDVFNSYPNITSPEYRAVKRMIDEHVKDLNRATQEILSNPENQEWRKVDGYN